MLFTTSSVRTRTVQGTRSTPNRDNTHHPGNIAPSPFEDERFEPEVPVTLLIRQNQEMLPQPPPFPKGSLPSYPPSRVIRMN
jgi:hypothetical protein